MKLWIVGLIPNITRLSGEQTVVKTWSDGLIKLWWGSRDSNPDAFQHMILNHARLPVPTLPPGPDSIPAGARIATRLGVGPKTAHQGAKGTVGSYSIISDPMLPRPARRNQDWITIRQRVDPPGVTRDHAALAARYPRVGVAFAADICRGGRYNAPRETISISITEFITERAETVAEEEIRLNFLANPALSVSFKRSPSPRMSRASSYV